MRQWHDNQNQQNSNFSQLLQERIEKSNPSNELNVEEQVNKQTEERL